MPVRYDEHMLLRCQSASLVGEGPAAEVTGAIRSPCPLAAIVPGAL
jgi:hypothetical protein